jgi:hypothetical protein
MGVANGRQFFNLRNKLAPALRVEPQDGPVPVLGVSYEHTAVVAADFDAAAAVGAAVAALAPAGVGYSLHLSPALVRSSSVCVRGSASARRWSNTNAALAIILGSWTVMPCTPVST